MSKKSKKALKKEQRRMGEAERLFLLSEISRVQTRLETKLKFLFNFLILIRSWIIRRMPHMMMLLIRLLASAGSWISVSPDREPTLITSVSLSIYAAYAGPPFRCAQGSPDKNDFHLLIPKNPAKSHKKGCERTFNPFNHSPFRIGMIIESSDFNSGFCCSYTNAGFNFHSSYASYLSVNRL